MQCYILKPMSLLSCGRGESWGTEGSFYTSLALLNKDES